MRVILRYDGEAVAFLPDVHRGKFISVRRPGGWDYDADLVYMLDTTEPLSEDDPIAELLLEELRAEWDALEIVSEIGG